ncbi:hypothetical protein D3C84_887100 [compost metagenome]
MLAVELRHEFNPRAVGSRRGGIGQDAGVAAQRNKTLDMNPAALHIQVKQRLLHGIHEGAGATDEGVRIQAPVADAGQLRRCRQPLN